MRFVQTGKLSFKDLANSIIGDLARISARQGIAGLGTLLAQYIGGGSTAGVSSTYGAQSFGNNTGWLTAGSSYGGGRASGGSVLGSSVYEVTEHGNPEVFEQGGKRFLLPGGNGRVIPMANTGTGSAAASAPIVNVSIEKGASEDRVETSVGSGGQLNIRVLVRDTMRGLISDGSMDNVMGARYGSRARGVPLG